MKIPFKVSARTAKLIGQENFSNPEGATIELVKNCYDADAKNCIVLFDVPFEETPQILTSAEYKRFSKNELINNCYVNKNGTISLKDKLSEKLTAELNSFFFSYNSIYIIDNGQGMNRKTIEDIWMEFGTGDKEINYISDEGRIKTGAKGIGRFALDRLGYEAEMWTVPKGAKNNEGSYWQMDWRQFDKPKAALSDIQAEIESQNLDLKELLAQKASKHPQLLSLISKKSFKTGTILRIYNLKDFWNGAAQNKVYKSLEALIPPKDLAIPFSVHFYSLQNTKSFGAVETSYFNDYDYKVSAKYDSKTSSVELTYIRNELDLKRIKKEYSFLFKNAKSPYDLKTLEKKEFKVIKPAHEILSWEPDSHNKSLLKTLGDFNFTFYFLKLSASKEIYPYRDINQKERRALLDKFGGIKIYRDSFRVRPYGDSGNDWLKLGDRAAASPAGAGQRIGDWRVGPNQIAGIVTISRIENPKLVDKSDRGSLQENETFTLLQTFLISILAEFELDRSKIFNPFFIDHKEREAKERDELIRKEAEALADKIVVERLKVEERVYGVTTNLFKNKQQEEEKAAFSKTIKESLAKFDKRDEHAEIAQVRTLASLGLIVSSFAHELKEVKNNYDDIHELLRLTKKVVPDNMKQKNDYIDILNIIELLKTENEKISHWVEYSLTAIKKDKRKRGLINFRTYFESLAKNWQSVLNSRNIEFQVTIKSEKNYSFKAFEMDLNTIFNNLINNSIDAFHNLKTIRDRKIHIEFSVANSKIRIIYSDNGAGLPTVFRKEKEKIFLPFVTSKKDKNGKDIGTGLGMYLVKNVLDDNNGSIEIIDSATGFKTAIELPTRKN